MNFIDIEKKKNNIFYINMNYLNILKYKQNIRQY